VKIDNGKYENYGRVVFDNGRLRLIPPDYSAKLEIIGATSQRKRAPKRYDKERLAIRAKLILRYIERLGKRDGRQIDEAKARR